MKCELFKIPHLHLNMKLELTLSPLSSKFKKIMYERTDLYM